MRRPEDYAETSDSVTSNFEPGEINAEVVEQLQTGPFFAQHAAWDFCGYVWWDAEAGLWREEVWRYHSPVGWHAAESLDDLIREVNDEWGWN